MISRLANTTVSILMLISQLSIAMAFQIPHQHHHPIYVQYYKAKLEKESQRPGEAPSSDVIEARGSALAIGEQDYVYSGDVMPSSQQLSYNDQAFVPIEAEISTPISYDEDTGMVQTAVRAIVKHPIVSFVDHQVVGLSSTLVISLGAVHEMVDCLEMEWAHHATSSTEGLLILSLGHALHYGRETIRQLVEMDATKEGHEKQRLSP
mmetsp:Transcript_75889/g.209838  ORF Transcript_75889/g.209838 Transcript_75889/m.209838 type:complete len:207 (-) Transcript_75889:644-1264(-)